MNKLVMSFVSVLTSVSAIASAGSLSFSTKKVAAPVAPASTDVVTLTPDNLVTLRGEVTGASVSRAIEQISLTKANDVYLYINSPGGSVIDGLQLTSFLLTTPKRVTCVVNFGASMAFVITEACSTRIIQQSGVLMQHEASFGIGSQPEPHVVSFIGFIRGVTETMKRAEAGRMGISYEDYRKITRNDLWLFGEQAVVAGAADAVKGALCDARLFAETEVEVINSGFFVAAVTWSKCPLLGNPKEVKIGGLGGIMITEAQAQSFASKLSRYLDRNYINIASSLSTRDFSRLELNDLLGN